MTFLETEKIVCLASLSGLLLAICEKITHLMIYPFISCNYTLSFSNLVYSNLKYELSQTTEKRTSQVGFYLPLALFNDY